MRRASRFIYKVRLKSLASLASGVYIHVHVCGSTPLVGTMTVT